MGIFSFHLWLCSFKGSGLFMYSLLQNPTKLDYLECSSTFVYLLRSKFIIRVWPNVVESQCHKFKSKLKSLVLFNFHIYETLLNMRVFGRQRIHANRQRPGSFSSSFWTAERSLSLSLSLLQNVILKNWGEK